MTQNEQQFIDVCLKHQQEILLLMEKNAFDLKDCWVSYRKKSGKIVRIKITENLTERLN